MPVFYPLKDIAHAKPWQIGEMAMLLHQLQQAGHIVPESWIIPAEYFERSLQALTTREPVFGDWPHLLWSPPKLTGYATQNFAQRLRQPLLGLNLNLPLQALLKSISTPAVRLLPSLWFGEALPSADFSQMMEAQICWAEKGIVEMAVKNLWAEMVSAHSLAYWNHFQRKEAERSRPYPEHIGVAIVVQAVEPVQLSGTLTVRSDNTIHIQMIQGLPKAMSESCPDSYQGYLPHSHTFPWQQGYQEQSYQPADAPLSPSALETCLTAALIPTTAQEIISSQTEIALFEMAKQFQTRATRPLQAEWLLPMLCGASLQIAQAFWWSLVPPSPQPLETSPNLLHQISGHAASPGHVVGLALVIKPGEPLPTSAKQHIIVASEVAPDWLPLLKTATAVVSEKGGLTCHAAILARELQLPAVVGVANATHHFRTGDALRLDGDRGLVEILPTHPVKTHSPPSLNPIPEFDHDTEIWLNLSQPDQAEKMALLPVAGVGLLRSEWLMMSVLDRQHPYHWLENGQQERLIERLVTQLRPIVKAFFPRPVRYRTLDIRSSEFAHLVGAPAVESNPMLGVRGTFSYQQYPEFFRLELQVLKALQAEGYTNLQLLLPFVRTVEEVDYCQSLVQEAGIHYEPTFQLWMMAEVPSALFLLPKYVAAGIQGIAIGTNDLTQLVLGIDRDHALLSSHFDERHPAVQAAIAQLIQQAQTLEIPCILCGVAPAHYPEFVKSLVKQGVTGISVDAGSVEAIARAIGQAEAVQS